MSPLELQRMAVRIETFQRTSTHGWHPADEMEFKRRLPGGRHANSLPDPKTLRELAKKGGAEPGYYVEAEARIVRQMALNMDTLIQRNDPRNPRRMVREIARGHHPFF